MSDKTVRVTFREGRVTLHLDGLDVVLAPPSAHAIGEALVVGAQAAWGPEGVFAMPRVPVEREEVQDGR
jgi:hypothetical protein